MMMLHKRRGEEEERCTLIAVFLTTESCSPTSNFLTAKRSGVSSSFSLWLGLVVRLGGELGSGFL